jgi:hypothetical protein
VIIFLQIFLNAKSYRAVANTAIGWLRMGPREATALKHISNKPLKTA